MAPPYGPFWDFVNSFDPSGGVDHHTSPPHLGPFGPFGAEHHRGPPGGRCGGPGGRRGGHAHGGRGGPGAHRGGPRGFGGHPFWTWAQQFAGENDEEGEHKDFMPPLDTFKTSNSYIFHLALPGAKKEDVGVNYDADKNELTIAGVVHRPGDEEFLKTLQGGGERRVGVFERKISLGEKQKDEEIDVENITAKMEDGILVVTVPRFVKEKEWVEIKKVDIE